MMFDKKEMKLVNFEKAKKYLMKGRLSRRSRCSGA